MTFLINVLLSFLNPTQNMRYSQYNIILQSVHLIQRQRYKLQRSRVVFQSRQTSTPVGGIGLDSLKNTAEDGLYLKQSIQHWLDKEYIPQAIHLKIGIEVEKIYSQRRLIGVTDLGEMLMDIGTSLEPFDMEVFLHFF